MGRPLEFTGEKKQLFLDALERSECIRTAAAEVGVLPGSVACARQHDKAFGAALEATIASIREGRALVRRLETGRVEARHDGFTPEKRRRYIKTLAKTGCRSDAAKVAGVSDTTADRWRRKDEEFARQCEAALHQAASHIDTLAWERGVTGIEEPVFHEGKMVGTRLKRSDSIFRMIMIGSNPKKYGRMGAVGRKRLEKRERERIEREVHERISAAQPTFDESLWQLRKSLEALAEREIRENGYTRGPMGQLVPPGWKMVWTGEGPPPEPDAAWDLGGD